MKRRHFNMLINLVVWGLIRKMEGSIKLAQSAQMGHNYFRAVLKYDLIALNKACPYFEENIRNPCPLPTINSQGYEFYQHAVRVIHHTQDLYARIKTRTPKFVRGVASDVDNVIDPKKTWQREE